MHLRRLLARHTHPHTPLLLRHTPPPTHLRLRLRLRLRLHSMHSTAAAAAPAAATDTRPPLIAVIGATGTGKSNLAVDLALALNGEIINADAMQMYEGLPIITNKITPKEARGVPHHLLGVLDVRDAWQVGRFVAEAGRIIAEIHARGKLPILVGGTHYYIQSLLYPTPLPPTSIPDTTSTPDTTGTPDPSTLHPLLTPATPTPVLHAHLASIDPEIASHWHPHDRRKILRSLTIYYTTGQPPSTLYAAQPRPRSPYRPLVLWVHAHTPALRTRLDTRVDAMLQRGMAAEIEAMKSVWDTSAEGSIDTASGIWQSIGFKEFLPFLSRRGELGVAAEACGVDAAAAPVEELAEMLAAAIDAMKTATRQYAKAQVRWIRQKLLPALEEAGEAVYVLDSTVPEAFGRAVGGAGVEVAAAFLARAGMPDARAFGPLAAEMLAPGSGGRGEKWGARECRVCATVCVGEEQWLLHVRSNRHKKAVGREKRGAEVEAWRAWEVERRRWKEGGCVGEEPPRPGTTAAVAEVESGDESGDEGVAAAGMS